MSSGQHFGFLYGWHLDTRTHALGQKVRIAAPAFGRVPDVVLHICGTGGVAETSGRGRCTIPGTH